jgi:outer membrane protein, adhesin transport system
MKQVKLPLLGLLAACCQLLFTTAAVAQQQPTADPLREAAQRAISSNPEVTARLNAFRASVDEVDVARGGFLPRVDLNADASRVRDRIDPPSRLAPNTRSLTSTGIALTATQLLWDGLTTSNQVQRLDHARLVRYFEFIESSEQVALESAKAYVDVARARQLVRLAEDNYVQHRQVFDQIQSKVKAGVGRGVDLEQVTARLALAESNLATESSNLHDVTERYRRVVGAIPPAQLPLTTPFDRGLPASATAALEQSAKRNAQVAAAVENFRSAQSQSKERDGLFQPRVEARVRTGAGSNFDGVADQKRETSAGIFLNWNLYNGGSDQARVRQSANLLNQAADSRDKACRDARQTAAIAFNDVRNLTEQISYLDRNVLSSERARVAYREQFDIGQRNLLDLLNSENELYAARRALTGAEHDVVVAKARSHAASSSLVAALGLTRAGSAEDEPQDGRFWQAGDDAAARCPLSATELALAPKSDLDTRARAASPSPVAATVAPAAASLIAAAPSQAASAKAARADPPTSTPVSQRLLDWAAAWSTKDVTRYISFYDASFKPGGVSRNTWFNNRSKLLKKDGPIELKISNVQRRTVSSSLIETTFDQAYTSPAFKDKTRKTITWKRVGSEWYIVKEAGR